MSEIKTKKVWVAWTNTNLTDGYGTEYPLCVCEGKETALRLGVKGGVQGSQCRVSEEDAVLWNGKWLVVGKIEIENEADKKLRQRREIKEGAIERARAAGVSPADIIAMIA